MEGLSKLKDNSINCVVTSPPYWGLRDYGTAKWEGGNPKCDHKQTVARHDGGRVNSDGFHGSAASDSDKGAVYYRDICGKCGARRIDRQIGLEATPEEYVARMVEVFREVHRVLRDDGTVWLNLGSSYAGGGRAGADGEELNLEIRNENMGLLREVFPVSSPKTSYQFLGWLRWLCKKMGGTCVATSYGRNPTRCPRA